MTRPLALALLLAALAGALPAAASERIPEAMLADDKARCLANGAKDPSWTPAAAETFCTCMVGGIGERLDMTAYMGAGMARESGTFHPALATMMEIAKGCAAKAGK